MFPPYFIEINGEKYKISGQKFPCFHKWETIKITRGKRHPAYRCPICEAYARRYGPDYVHLFTTGKGKLHYEWNCADYKYIVDMDREDYCDAVNMDLLCNKTGDAGYLTISPDVMFSRYYGIPKWKDIYPHITYQEYLDKRRGF